jgi:hypothetical protein
MTFPDGHPMKRKPFDVTKTLSRLNTKILKQWNAKDEEAK